MKPDLEILEQIDISEVDLLTDEEIKELEELNEQFIQDQHEEDIYLSGIEYLYDENDLPPKKIVERRFLNEYKPVFWQENKTPVRMTEEEEIRLSRTINKLNEMSNFLKDQKTYWKKRQIEEEEREKLKTRNRERVLPKIEKEPEPELDFCEVYYQQRPSEEDYISQKLKEIERIKEERERQDELREIDKSQVIPLYANYEDVRFRLRKNHIEVIKKKYGTYEIIKFLNRGGTFEIEGKVISETDLQNYFLY